VWDCAARADAHRLADLAGGDAKLREAVHGGHRVDVNAHHVDAGIAEHRRAEVGEGDAGPVAEPDAEPQAHPATQ